MKLLAALLFLGAALFEPFVLAQVASAQVIEGTVVDSITGAPIGGASVQIEDARKAPYQAVSDEHGAFRIEGVADGTYTAFALKTGFLTVQDEAARRPFGVVAGLDPVHLKLSLTPRGRISGRVFDASDRPVAGAIVSLLRESGAGQAVNSGPDGGFVIDADPGSYFLSARAPLKLPPPPLVGDQRYAWVKTWFPGVADVGAAQKILIRPGAELAGQDIQLRAVNAYRIRGQVRYSNGDPAPGFMVVLDCGDAPLRRTSSGKDGSFEFADLYACEWHLSTEPATEPGTDRALRAFAAVTVNGRDPQPVELRLAAPFSVPTELLLETPDSTTKIQASVVLEPQGYGAPASGRREKDGNYEIDGLYAGRSYLIVSFPPTGAGYYLSSITMGDRDVMGQMAEFSPGSAPVKIVYRSDGGSVRGHVEDCASASVIMVPQDPAFQRGDLTSVRLARCSEGDRFEIRYLRPGRYYAFAFDPWDGNRLSLIASLPELINKAVSVDVKANQTANVELKVSSAF